ncbi:hypothetical protein [Prevotella sp. E2-28]|uniref:hypothetical protein n=1 Tax=Prevotella sp. E2-28 TaxID=2913620 RepID=UPI001EDBA83A|nr:hypothetical protein [Prevotella sp. E2-28]UKK52640.1 hypothetical protein L6465_08480 [Prevotella sp. E2-28]
MKANEMPKRIYLFDYNDAMVTPIECDTVYVREDAFIEKAIEYMITHNMQALGISCKMDECIIEDFRRYMKGE